MIATPPGGLNSSGTKPAVMHAYMRIGAPHYQKCCVMVQDVRVSVSERPLTEDESTLAMGNPGLHKLHLVLTRFPCGNGHYSNHLRHRVFQ